ncbi:hypothetical protein MKK75_21875 [Methylobacterium sp. J-030]|uniref:hypothetical protein n=1 Tax=Methylobacterium sp. J-030 TaxID=2836627 RepID=UPI001FB9EE17|nr:hypothetical protein [Methylobacterium sp. J-030]MCJ2071412.1 hypothetical protein [Methylobacterium sp. J-030]
MNVRVADNITAARIDAYLETAPAHLKPIMLAVRDRGCAWVTVPQKVGRFDLPKGRPLITVIGDDLHVAMGPAGFHRKSIRRVIAASRFVSIVAGEPMTIAYATPALGAAGLGLNGTIIETRPEFEMHWVDLVQREAPNAQLIIVSVKERGH